MSNLGDYVRRRRELLGLNQKELGDRAGLPATTINRVEKGVTKLPAPFARRQLADALGVTHLDILVAAGELTAEEAGTGSSVTPPASEARLLPIIRSINWTPAIIDGAASFLKGIERMALELQGPVIDEDRGDVRVVSPPAGDEGEA